MDQKATNPKIAFSQGKYQYNLAVSAPFNRSHNGIRG